MALESYSSWSQRAKCKGVDTNQFYTAEKYSVGLAKKFCRDCPVVNPCKLYAIVHGEKGVWGGTSYNERVNNLNKNGLRQILIEMYREAGLLEHRPAHQ